MSNEALALPSNILVGLEQLEAGLVDNDVLTWDAGVPEWKSAAVAGGSSTQINTGAGNAVPVAGVIQLANSTGLVGTGAGNTLTIINRRYENDIVVGAADADYATIQDGIDAASLAGGGTVRIREGIYVENLTMADGVILCGMGVADGSSTAANTVIQGSVDVPNGVAYCAMSNLSIRTTDATSLTHNGDGKIVLENVNIHRNYTVFQLVSSVVLTGGVVNFVMRNCSITVTFSGGGPNYHFNFSGMSAGSTVFIDGLTTQQGIFSDGTSVNLSTYVLKNINAIDTSLSFNGLAKMYMDSCNFAATGLYPVQDDPTAIYDIRNCTFENYSSWATGTVVPVYPVFYRNCRFNGTTDVNNGLYEMIDCTFLSTQAFNITNGPTVNMRNCRVDCTLSDDTPNICEFVNCVFNNTVSCTRGVPLFVNCLFKNTLSTSGGNTVNLGCLGCTFNMSQAVAINIQAAGDCTIRNCGIINTGGIGIQTGTGFSIPLSVFKCVITTTSHCINLDGSETSFTIVDNILRSTSGGVCIRLNDIRNSVGVVGFIQKNIMSALLGSANITVNFAFANTNIRITNNELISSNGSGCITNSGTNVTSGYNMATGNQTTVYSGVAPVTTLVAMA